MNFAEGGDAGIPAFRNKNYLPGSGKNMQKKTVNRIVNVIVIVIFAIVLLITIGIFTSRGKGYTNLFGTAMVAVRSDSMEGDKEDSFNKGDLLFIRILKSDEEKKSLKEGDIITFYDSNMDGQINTHRIIKDYYADGIEGYLTRGDKAPEGTTDGQNITAKMIVGVYEGRRVGWLGSVALFFQSSTGFLVCVVLPALLLVAYCVYDVLKNVRERNREKLAASVESEKERMRAEILAELEKKDPEEKDEE